MVSIKNQYISAMIKFRGAELSSLKKLENNTEYLWQADPTHWGRHAPVLFPIVGRLRDDEYEYNGRHYAMTQHGFARDLDFEVLAHGTSTATLRLRSGPKTLLSYPFHFELIIKYELIQSKIAVTYKVLNQEKNQLYFSIGAHPAFNCPLDNSHSRSDYAFEFSSQETADRQHIEDGLRTGNNEQVLLADNKIPITDDLFDQDALIFDNLVSSSVSLVKGDEKVLTVHAENWPYMGLWSKSAEAPFVCIEPWYGIADSKNAYGDVANKEGIIALSPLEAFECQYLIAIH